MEEPIIARDGNDVVFLYENVVQIRARNPSTRRGRPEIEVQITIQPQHQPTGRGRVYWGTIGPLSKSNVRETVKRCNESASGFPWDLIIDDFCWQIVEQLRKPPKVTPIGKGPIAADQPMYLVYPLLQKDEPTILYGDGGVGKSLVAAFVSVLATDGLAASGLNAEPGKVLYVDWETNEKTVWERIWAIKRALNRQEMLIDRNLEVQYQRASQPLAKWGDKLSEIVVTNEISLVVIDSLGMALAGSFNDAEPVIEIFQTLRTLNTTTLIIDHVGKAEGASERGPIGSRFKHNIARSVWEIRKVDSEAGFRVGLYHRKTNRGRLHKPFGFQIDVEEGGDFLMESATFSRIEIEDDEGLSEGLSPYERIRNYLKPGAQPMKDIVEELADINPNTIKSLLRRHFQQVDRGTYGLKARPADPAPAQQTRMEH